MFCWFWLSSAHFPLCDLPCYQRVLNVLLRARLSRRRMIWLPLVTPVSKLDREHTGRLRKRGFLLTGDGMGGAQIISRLVSLVFYKTFNTLRLLLFNCCTLQPLNSDKHLPPSPFTGKFFKITHFALISLSPIFIRLVLYRSFNTLCLLLFNCCTPALQNH